MGVIAKDHRFDGRSTESLFPFLPIHSTLPGTELAISEERISLLDSLSQLPLRLQFLIGWNPFYFFLLRWVDGDRREKK